VTLLSSIQFTVLVDSQKVSLVSALFMVVHTCSILLSMTFYLIMEKYAVLSQAQKRPRLPLLFVTLAMSLVQQPHKERLRQSERLSVPYVSWIIPSQTLTIQPLARLFFLKSSWDAALTFTFQWLVQLMLSALRVFLLLWFLLMLKLQLLNLKFALPLIFSDLLLRPSLRSLPSMSQQAVAKRTIYMSQRATILSHISKWPLKKFSNFMSASLVKNLTSTLSQQRMKNIEKTILINHECICFS